MTTSLPAVDVPVVDLDPYDEAVLADPRGFQETLRETGPLVWLSRYEVYAAGRYEEVRAGLANHRDLVSGYGVGVTDRRKEKVFRTPSLLIEADPPDHTPRRALMDALLSSRALRHLKDEFARIADGLVDELLDRGEVDAVADVAEAYPLRVFPEVIGLSQEVRPHLLTYGDVVFNAGGPANAVFARAVSAPGAEAALAAIADQTRREHSAPGGIGAAIWEAVDRGELPEDEAPLLVRSLLTAGVDTTVAAIAATLQCLAAAPDQWALVRADPRRARFAFEEAIRHESPVQTFYRTAVRDVPFGDAVLPSDGRVYLSLGAANHDPRRFPDPDRFDLERSMSGHVGFGMGVHQCVGQHFGRLEGEAVLGALARRVERLELAGPPVRRLNNTLRAWGSIPLRLTAA
ncbi:cytochrome P450 [Pseudonocardia sp. WMMC193]|uniref:cytochrome P450 n=1 Tax=Pseudonocardia sp. WMMC193 TaxID=2911965 RepID=UPI001F358863|nr:cytochrome P450 [Pseudonocardia sp. WMMC193]MCF7553672.1 cytochrome P450 [Pseudonocardia sp. WMMC193]